MPQLKSPRREAFAQAYVRGATAANATTSYFAAGFKCTVKSGGASASRLLREPDVVRRIAELQSERHAIETKATEQAIARLTITKEAILGELAKIAFANVLDYGRVEPDGSLEVDFSNVSRDQAAAIAQVVVEPRTNGRGKGAKPGKRTRVKLADKRAALVDLGKHFGLFVERRHVTHDYADMSDEQLAEYIRNVAIQLAQNGIDVPSLVGIRTGDVGSPPAVPAYDAVALPSVPEATAIPRRRTDSS